MTKTTEKSETIVDIEEVYDKTEHFIEEHKKQIGIITGIIVFLVVAYISWHKFYITPREKEAQSFMFTAELSFAKDSFKLALDGAGIRKDALEHIPGNFLGFLDIADEYSHTKSANLAKYYAGICYLHLGEYENAIKKLEDFTSDDYMVSSIARGAIGDAYMELGNNDKALKYYLKAAENSKNNFTTPVYLMKAGLAYEDAGKYKDAVEVYEKIRDEYAETMEGRDVPKYIARAKAQIN